ncbi:hypothetical protein L228DRAFT_8193 [Xylona heveae TC161]|uniref:Uncharacterized protein n=1 Tax=Xylona heveae (strain CBS 132557 / TC161) TaxID=1328760 RepID=A0A165JH61_XYLHT|nr:hypothetical protein L228DRAFT_8193 [Xylona heveae TC161]KZF26234.1 hypothetical protein L228DRAFT_8193 [Xylona heveae TC161]
MHWQQASVCLSAQRISRGGHLFIIYPSLAHSRCSVLYLKLYSFWILGNIIVTGAGRIVRLPVGSFYKSLKSNLYYSYTIKAIFHFSAQLCCDCTTFGFFL